MSLLIKALEQAAKDRKTTRVEPPPLNPSGNTAAEPTLEPAPPPRVRAAATRGVEEAPANEPQRSGPGSSSAAPSSASAPAAASLAFERPASHPRAGGSLADLARVDARHQRARAAAVMQAAGGSAANALALVRANPVMLFGALAVLFGIGFGIYVYLQIAHPEVFVPSSASSKPQAPAQAPAAPTPTPAQSPPAPPPAATTASVATQQPAHSPSSAPAPVGPASVPGAPTPSGGTIATASAEMPRSAAAAPVPASAVVASAPVPEPSRAAEKERAAAETPRERAAKGEDGALAAAARAPKAAAQSAEISPPPRERISVSPTNAQPRLNPALAQAYTLLQTGKAEEAHALYTKVNQSEPLNIDALLGLAYIAGREGRADEATQLYIRILQLNPRHALAQAGLISLMGRADPAASESRLKQLIAREPSAFLHFVLGNVYAEQSQWPQAQQSFFQAHHLEPGNPDYAYNLAVGLDHLKQAKLALNYYRRAEQLASTHGRANFSLEHVRERIGALAAPVE